MKTESAAKENVSSTQDVCIDLPGETVKCWRSSDKIKVTLRKHRDVIFDINLKQGATYTVESKTDFYSPREKKLLRKVEFQDGEVYQLWVGRNFKGSLVLKSGSTVIAAVEPIKLDQKKYNDDPKTKPEPMMVVFGKREVRSDLICRPDDPYGMMSTQGALKPMFDPKLAVLKNYGTEFDYHLAMEPPEATEYVAVAEASAREIQPQVLKQLDSGQAVEGTITEIFKPPEINTAETGIYGDLASAVGVFSGNYYVNANWQKETLGYLQEHWRALDKLLMRARIEKRAVGKYRVVFKGHLLGKSVAQLFGSAAKGKSVHKTYPVGSKETAFLDGGFGKTGRTGFGGIKRLMLTTSENFRGGVKVQIIGTVIDIIGDANTVYCDTDGSKDLSEFLGRAGVTLIKAAVTAAIGAALASLITVGLGAMITGGAPVLLIAALVVGGFILAAYLVDGIDNSLGIKESIADWAR